MKTITSRLFLFLLVIFLIETTIAQVKIGAKAGYSIGRITDDSDNIYTKDYESSSGVDLGVFAEFPVSDLFSLQLEVLYTQRGGERTGLQPIPTAALEDFGSIVQLNYMLHLQGKAPVTDTNPLYADFKNVSELRYIEIPFLGKLGWGDTWRFYVEAGPYIGFLASSTQKTSGTSLITLDAQGTDPLRVLNPIYDPSDPSTGALWVPVPPQDFTAETDTKEELNAYNVGFHAGSGLIRKINEKHEVFVGFRGSWGARPIQKDEVFGKSHVGGLVFSLGYAYTL
ncbi:PorT family protein [Lutimonas saemankumensis]|uniref:porin family protein n=1 Tax=Lutimonas saemankumensis TaxID=483016 RepID=UPI001CD591BB|nr:porin family protein [Lutimonas saemankumensis]MCA0933510.1 PorT family protein [Lutimonas saemankumensis]